MKQVTAYIETGDDNTYNVYVKDKFPFGFFGEGNSVNEAKEDFLISFNEMRELYKERTGKTVACDFVFKYDIVSFFSYYSKLFSMPALERLTGINQKQLHHYAMGIKQPREAQKKKIETALHKLGNELTAIAL